MADGAGAGLDVVTQHIARRVQVRVLEVVLLGAGHDFLVHRVGRRRRQRRQHYGTPGVRTVPVRRVTVVLQQGDFVLPRDRPMRVDVRTPLDLLAREIDDDVLAVDVDAANRHRRDEHLSSRQPASRIHDEVSHGPVDIVEIAGLYFADRAVGGREVEPNEVLHADEHGVLLLIAECSQRRCKAVAGGTSIARLRPMLRAVGLLIVLALLATPVACRRQSPPPPSAAVLTAR